MVYNATFNNISIISLGSVLLMEEIGEAIYLPYVTNNLYYIFCYIFMKSTN